ncbi:MAG: tetratricopeptide repeat protein [Pirellulaceae bacterium]
MPEVSSSDQRDLNLSAGERDRLRGWGHFAEFQCRRLRIRTWRFIDWFWQFAQPPYNFPMFAGFGFLILGLAMIAYSLKDPWYQVPVRLHAAELVDQSDLPPTRRVPDGMVAETKRSKFENPCKAVIVCVLCWAGFTVVRREFAARSRAHAFGILAAMGLTVGLAFAHLVVVDDPDVSHLAAWMYAQHDGLSWYGGDIYTSREYEIPGGGYDILVKDPPKFLAVITPPYLNFDISTLGDFLTWAGLCHSFWIFIGKGWASLMMGSLLLLVGVLCTRQPGQTRGLSGETVTWVLIRVALILVPWIGVVCGRSLWVASALANAQSQYEAGEHSAALESMRVYREIMPCLAYDSGLMVQEGVLENLLGVDSDRARFAQAFLLESDGYSERAQQAYLQLMDSSEQCVAREAARYVLRRAIVHFNAGEESIALDLTERFRLNYPCMPKAAYLRMLIAVRADDFDQAQGCLQAIYASVQPVGMPESRGYKTSGHQHLAQLAFDRGDVIEMRRQAVYRMEQQPK